jgi:hypothetical protein
MKKITGDTRTTSVITGNRNLETLFTIEDFPVFIGNTTQDQKDDMSSDMVFDICNDCGIVQLKNTISPDLIYSKYHSEAIGSVWENHHIQLADIIRLNTSKNAIDSVLEIGGSNAKLPSIVLKTNNDIEKWTIVEPNIPSDYQHIDKKITFISDFFKPELIVDKPDLIVHSHTLEHIYDPDLFLQQISNVLEEDKMHIFSVPNLFRYLQNKFINTLNFEHNIFLTEEIIDYLLSKNKLEIIEKVYYLDHSIIYVTKKNSNLIDPILPNKYDEYKNMFLDYIDYYKNLVSDLNNKIDTFNGDIYLFGGHVFSQFLIALGLKTDNIKYILDNSPLKHNTRLYGTNLIIKSPNEIQIADNSAVILKVGGYREEIINGLTSINSKLIFWE